MDQIDNYACPKIEYAPAQCVGYCDQTFADLNTFMCSKFCPCPDVGDKLSQWTKLTPQQALDNNRLSWYSDNGEPEPWVFNGLTYAVGTTEGVEGGQIHPESFNTFLECVNDAAQRDRDFWDFDYTFVQHAKQIVQMDATCDGLFSKKFDRVESKYKCSGCCQNNLFYLNRPVTKGVPQNYCIEPYGDDAYSSFNAVAIWSIICGTFLVCLSISICCLKKHQGRLGEVEQQEPGANQVSEPNE